MMMNWGIFIVIIVMYTEQCNGYLCNGMYNRMMSHVIKGLNAAVDPVTALPVSLPAPEPKLQRTDNIIERMALFALSSILALAINTTDRKLLVRNIGFSYTNFVRITKLLIAKSRNISDVTDAIIKILTVILPKFVTDFFRTNYAKNSRYICEASSLWFTFGFIEWLVGPAERSIIDIISYLLSHPITRLLGFMLT